MIALIWDNTAQRADLSRPTGKNILVDVDLALETSVFISLFTDRRASEDDELADGEDPRGWWGDTYAENDGDQIGSKLWLLAKSGKNGLQRAVEYAEQALAWMLVDGVASSVKATATRVNNEIIAIQIAIEHPDRIGPWLHVWEVKNAI
jgi:phage gp46-like protein